MKAILLLISIIFAVSCAHHGHKGHHGKKTCQKTAKFKKMDADGDGKVTKKEFAAAGDAKWVKLDANKDGVITEEEHTTYWKSKKKARKGCCGTDGKKSDKKKSCCA